MRNYSNTIPVRGKGMFHQDCRHAWTRTARGAVMSFLGLAVVLGAAGCGSQKPSTLTGSNRSNYPCSGSAVIGCTPPPTATLTGCQEMSTLLNGEQSTIQGLQSGSVTEVAAESTITGTNGRLAQDQETVGTSSILGITLEQLVSENGLFSEALDQSVPVTDLGELFDTVDQDISNLRTNCHS